MFDVIIGRSEADRKAFGNAGTIFLGKQYVTMGQTTSLSNPIYLDVVRSHVVFIVGKRGSGKSYSCGVIAEGISDLPDDIRENISIILLDTMGVYWTMKYPNKKEELLLKQWGFASKSLPVQIYTPTGFHKKYLQDGIPTDHPFSIKPAELDAQDWIMTFDIPQNDHMAILIERVLTMLKEVKQDFSIDEIITAVRNDQRSEKQTKDAVENRFLNTKTWGIFDVQGTTLAELAGSGQVTVLDLSCYATQEDGWKIKNLVVGLVAQKLFIQRMIARKNEEYAEVHGSLHYFTSEPVTKKKMPLVWLVLDEAHEFLPNQGQTLATQPLVTILREGRQPGISLILASQQPGKIHTDVMTQADAVIAHRITAKLDTDALGILMQSYMREGLAKQVDDLPRTFGSALVFDDTNERIYPMKIRPRFTWHGGESPTALPENKQENL